MNTLLIIGVAIVSFLLGVFMFGIWELVTGKLIARQKRAWRRERERIMREDPVLREWEEKKRRKNEL